MFTTCKKSEAQARVFKRYGEDGRELWRYFPTIEEATRFVEWVFNRSGIVYAVIAKEQWR